MKKLLILPFIAAMLFCTAIVTQGGNQKMVVKTELADYPVIAPFSLLEMVYISSPTEEVIPYPIVEKTEAISKGFVSQVFHPPANKHNMLSTNLYRRC